MDCCSYGTGCFLLYNTGNDIVYSTHGLITTVGYQFGNDKPVYALEVCPSISWIWVQVLKIDWFIIKGSVAIAGACFNWLRDNLEILPDISKTGLFKTLGHDMYLNYFIFIVFL